MKRILIFILLCSPLSAQVLAPGRGDFKADGSVPLTGDLDANGNNYADGGVMFLREQAGADIDVVDQGQIWVQTGSPNTLWFTDDAGTDFQLNGGGGGQFVFSTIIGDSGTNPVAELVTDSLSILGGNGIDTVGDSGADSLTIAVDGTVARLAAAQVLTNKTIDTASNTITIVEADISDLGAYLTSEANDLTAAVTWANVPNANITESSVTQHQAALAVTESQISDLQSYYVPSGTDVAIADGGTGQSTAQAAINALSAVSAATNEHVLTKDTGTGNATWKAAAGGGTPAGSDGQIQFNDSGSFGADSDLHWDDSNKRLGIGTATPGAILHIASGSSGATAATYADDFIIEKNGPTGWSLLAPDAVNNHIVFGSPSNNDYAVIRARYNSGSPSIDWFVDSTSTPKMTLTDEGHLGVNDTNPAATVAIDTPSLSTPGLSVSGAAGQTADLLTLDVAGSDKVIINSAGFLGLGVDPSQELHIKTNQNSNVQIETTGSTLGANVIFATPVGNWDFGTDGDTDGGGFTIRDRNDSFVTCLLIEQGAGDDALVIDSTGSIMIGTSTAPSSGGKTLTLGDNGGDPTMGTDTAGIYSKDTSANVVPFAADEADNVEPLVPYGASTTLGAAATTFAIEGSLIVVTGDGGGNTVATLTGGYAGKTIVLLFVDANVTITDTDAHTANTVDLAGAAANLTSADDLTLRLIHDGTSWYETSRSTN